MVGAGQFQQESDNDYEEVGRFLQKRTWLSGFDVIADIVADPLETVCYGFADILDRDIFTTHLQLVGGCLGQGNNDPEQEVDRDHDAIEKH